MGNNDKRNLSVYFTAGFPNLNDTAEIIKSLSEEGVSYIEVGVPFSDPLADGPVIQASATAAIENGMTLEILIKQLKSLNRQHADLILMGYYNVFLQYGFERLLDEAKNIGVKAFIIPDCPPEEYQRLWKAKFDQIGMGMIFLVTPACSDQRIQLLAELSHPFIYAVSDFSITGSTSGFSREQLSYFKKLNEMDLGKAVYLGFGISDNTTFEIANNFFDGAIIGSAFIKKLTEKNELTLSDKISHFVADIRK